MDGDSGGLKSVGLAKSMHTFDMLTLLSSTAGEWLKLVMTREMEKTIIFGGSGLLVKSIHA